MSNLRALDRGARDRSSIDGGERGLLIVPGKATREKTMELTAPGEPRRFALETVSAAAG